MNEPDAEMRQKMKRAAHWGLPVPGFVKPIVRVVYLLGIVAAEVTRGIYRWLIVEPVFRSICASCGKSLRIERIPYIRGRGRILVGSNVYISGKLGIAFSRHARDPEIVIGDRTFVGHQCSFAAGKKIEIGSDCLIAAGTRIQDNDGHPLDPERRRAGEPVPEDAIQSVRIHDGAWIAARAIILKGVTIGENAVVGAGAVVIKDVPANSVVAGNPADVVKRIGEKT